MSTNNQFDDPLNQQEISSIKPDLGTLGQKEKQEPRFTYSTAEYDSYIKNGFGAPLLQDRPDKWEVRFLNQVDLTKCKGNKIQVRILNMQYFCVSPVITWLVSIACAKLKDREMLTSPAVSINALTIKEKLIFPIAFLNIIWF